MYGCWSITTSTTVIGYGPRSFRVCSPVHRISEFYSNPRSYSTLKVGPFVTPQPAVPVACTMCGLYGFGFTVFTRATPGTVNTAYQNPDRCRRRPRSSTLELDTGSTQHGRQRRRGARLRTSLKPPNSDLLTRSQRTSTKSYRNSSRNACK